MNCKQGDIAIVVGGKYNRGKIVTCLRLLSLTEVMSMAPDAAWDDVPRWLVDTDIIHGPCDRSDDRDYTKRRFIRDAHLRPLRDIPGQDETLTWKEVPKTTSCPQPT